jgi:apolipoprotein N-acyltransferase
LNDPAVVAQVRAAVAAVNRPVLVGGLVVDAGYAGPTNSSLLWLPARGPVQRYDKVHLVPFGEYLPLRTWLEQHIGRFEQIPTDMRAGKRTGVFDGAGPRFGVLICFEVAYDDHVRQLVTGDAHYLVVQSNNSTYLGTDQPRQQFAITRLRALAHARGTVVATTTGVSAVIDQRGQVLATAPEVTTAVVTGRVPVVTGRSLADRLGDWVTPLALVVVTARLLRRQVA